MAQWVSLLAAKPDKLSLISELLGGCPLMSTWAHVFMHTYIHTHTKWMNEWMNVFYKIKWTCLKTAAPPCLCFDMNRPKRVGLKRLELALSFWSHQLESWMFCYIGEAPFWEPKMPPPSKENWACWKELQNAIKMEPTWKEICRSPHLPPPGIQTELPSF